MSALEPELDPFLAPIDVTPVHGVIADAAALAALWGTTRFVVVDTETIIEGDDLRCVSVAVVTCRKGFVLGKWQSLVNAQASVDPGSLRIHGLTDEHLADQPLFEDVADALRNVMTPADGEQVVFVAHNARFDVGVLRGEFVRIGQEMPDLPVLDTQGKFPRVVGVTPASRSLQDLCIALGIVHDREHDAMADATVCAEAAVALMRLAAAKGVRSTDELLAAVSGEDTTLTVSAVSAKSLRSRKRGRMLPEEHVEGHAEFLGPRAGTKMLAAWEAQVAECAELRCGHLAARVDLAGPDPAKLLPYVDAVLQDRCSAGDTAGAATVLGALLPLMSYLPPLSVKLGTRRAQVAWARARAPQLDALGRCAGRDLCPACREGEPCPLDLWPGAIASLALGDITASPKAFVWPNGRNAGRGGHLEWRRWGLDRMADEGVWLCVVYWRSVGQPTRADQVVELAWRAGCRHPDVADAYAGLIAAPGRLADIRSALAAAKVAMRTRNDSTCDGWNRLRGRIAQLEARRARLHVRLSDQFDQDGNAIPIRRHTPAAPRRTRPGRFERTGGFSAIKTEEPE